MLQIVLIGLGAGAATALLFASVVSRSPVSLLLAQLAPLPILIAALGWSHRVGLVAAFTAAVGLGAILGIYLFPAFLIGVGLPAWWLAYLALLARPTSNGAVGGLEWYPIGRLVIWSALIGTAVVIVSFALNFGTDKETFQAGLRNLFERAIQSQPGGADALARAEMRRATEFWVAAFPPIAAMLATLLNVFNLWLAGRIVSVSGRLQRPWPELSAMTLPPTAPVLLAAAMAGAFLPDMLGILSLALAASLLMAYAILGLAVLHAITRGLASRALALAATYAAIIMFAGLPILLMSMLGLADNAFHIRARFAGKAGPPTLRT